MDRYVSRCPWTFHTILGAPGQYRTKKAEDHQCEALKWTVKPDNKVREPRLTINTDCY